MTIRDVVSITNAKVLAGEEDLDQEITTAFGSDLMSDVLGIRKDCSMLMTVLQMLRRSVQPT